MVSKTNGKNGKGQTSAAVNLIGASPSSKCPLGGPVRLTARQRVEERA